MKRDAIGMVILTRIFCWMMFYFTMDVVIASCSGFLAGKSSPQTRSINWVNHSLIHIHMKGPSVVHCPAETKHSWTVEQPPALIFLSLQPLQLSEMDKPGIYPLNNEVILLGLYLSTLY